METYNGKEYQYYYSILLRKGQENGEISKQAIYPETKRYCEKLPYRHCPNCNAKKEDINCDGERWEGTGWLSYNYYYSSCNKCEIKFYHSSENR